MSSCECSKSKRPMIKANSFHVFWSEWMQSMGSRKELINFVDILSRDCRNGNHVKCSGRWKGLGIEVKCNCECTHGNSVSKSDSTRKMSKKSDPSPHRPVPTSTIKSMSYITVKAIESDTSVLQSLWPLFVVKELLDNACDFLNDYYGQNPNEDRKIAVTIKIGRIPLGQKEIVRIAVRNSNVDNIPVFENLDATFNYSIWYSTKRHQHRETCGSLGDFLKSLRDGLCSMDRRHR